MQSIRIVGQPNPEGAWLHRFRNYGEDVYVQLRDRCAVDIEEIDAATDTFHVKDIQPEEATAVAEILSSILRRHHLEDSVVIMPCQTEQSEVMVVLVVDTAFGDRLCEIAARRDTWVVPSEINRVTVEQIWQARKRGESGGTVSIWSGPMSTVTEEDWLGMLETIEVHHGDFWCVPSLDTLSVYGATVTPEISAALREYEYETVKPTELGFIAFKAPAA